MLQVYQDQEEVLLTRFREGCAESFNALYEKYWNIVYTSAFQRLKNHDQAQDVTQDIFTHLWLKKEELQIENLPAYLHICVRNRVLNLFEKERRYIPFEQLLHDNQHFQGDHADAAALRNEFLEAYNSLVDSLPLKRKRIFRHYYEDGLSTEEIADRLCLSRKTVQNQLGRTVSFLKASLSHLFLFCLLLFILKFF